MVKNKFINAKNNVKDEHLNNSKKELASDIFFGRKNPGDKEYDDMNRLLADQNDIQNKISKKEIEMDILVNKHRLVEMTDEEYESGISEKKIKIEEEMGVKLEEIKSLRAEYDDIGDEFDEVVKKIEKGVVNKNG